MLRLWRISTYTAAWLTLPLLSGCGWDVKPKGRGAAGNQLTVLKDPDVALELVNKLAPEQVKRYDVMHQPFEAAVQLSHLLIDSGEKARLEKLRKTWDTISFANVLEGKRFSYRVVLATSAGELHLYLFDNILPNQARNFIALCMTGAFSKTPMHLEDGVLSFGRPPGKEVYTLKARPLPSTIRTGSLFSFPAGDRTSGERFGVAAQLVPTLANQATVFGYVTNGNLDETFKQFVQADAKQRGSIMINEAKPINDTHGLFVDRGEVNLPTLGPDGEPLGRELGIFSGGAAPGIPGAEDTVIPPAPSDGKPSAPASPNKAPSVQEPTKATSPGEPKKPNSAEPKKPPAKASEAKKPAAGSTS